MRKLLLALGFMFSVVGCADVDDDLGVPEEVEADAGVDGEVSIGMKSQALGTACPARVYATLTTSDSRFNGSGWEGEWNNYSDGTFWGLRACENNTYGLHYVGYSVGRNCTAVYGTQGKGWLCGLNRIDCPNSAQVGAVTGYRQSVGGTKVAGTPGPITLATNPSAAFQTGSFDSVNQRIWCGYPVGITLTYTRPETY